MNPIVSLPSYDDVRPFSTPLSPSLYSSRSHRSSSNFSIGSSLSSSDLGEEITFPNVVQNLQKSLDEQMLCGVYYDILRASSGDLKRGVWDDVVTQTVDYCGRMADLEGLRYLAFALFSGYRRIILDPYLDGLAMLFTDEGSSARLVGRLLLKSFEHWKSAFEEDENCSEGEDSFLDTLTLEEALDMREEGSEKILCWHVGGRLALSALSRQFACAPYDKGVEVSIGSMPRHLDDCEERISYPAENFDIPVLLTGDILKACLRDDGEGNRAVLPKNSFSELKNKKIQKIKCAAPPKLALLTRDELLQVAGSDLGQYYGIKERCSLRDRMGRSGGDVELYVALKNAQDRYEKSMKSNEKDFNRRSLESRKGSVSLRSKLSFRTGLRG